VTDARFLASEFLFHSIFLSAHMTFKYALAFLLFPLAAMAGESWLLPFPDISFDSAHVYFAGERWIAVYSPSSGEMGIRARAAVSELPPMTAASDSIAMGTARYRVLDNTLSSSVPGGPDSVRTLPDPTSDAIECLTAGGGARPDFADVSEVMGPVTARDNRVWFGLTLKEHGHDSLAVRNTLRVVGGIGWYNPDANRFGRVYSPSLFGYRPVWIGARQDSIYLLMSKTDTARHVQSKLMAYSIQTSALVEINLPRLGVPGDAIRRVVLWKDTLLIATDRAVAVWKPARKPGVWMSRAYEAPETEWLYLTTFGDAKDGSDPVEFLPFKSNLPLEVKAKIGGWMQMVSPIELEGMVKAAEWDKHRAVWSKHLWNCGDSPCFARVRVEANGKQIDSDFTNTAFTEVSRHHDDVKVSFRAGWAREEDLVPVMLAP
jgi:hypothetical protein